MKPYNSFMTLMRNAGIFHAQRLLIGVQFAWNHTYVTRQVRVKFRIDISWRSLLDFDDQLESDCL